MDILVFREESKQTLFFKRVMYTLPVVNVVTDFQNFHVEIYN
jgi:hypothetical protein